MTKTRSLLGNECWPFVPGKVNPADLATRHNFINVMIKRWKNGPEFLPQPEDNFWSLQKIAMAFLQELYLSYAFKTITKLITIVRKPILI